MDDAAQLLRLDRRPTDILLTACAGLNLLVKDGQSYRNSELADAYLVKDRRYYFGSFVKFLDSKNYPAWMQVTSALHNNRPISWDPNEKSSLFETDDPVFLETFWEGMHSVSVATARAFVDAVDLSRSRRLLDVGGGGGAYAIELCKRNPNLAVTIFDLPFVCSITESKITAAGFGDRITTRPGDFLADDGLPHGYDAMLLSGVLHDWNEMQCRAIITKCAEALPPGGQLIITELFVDDDRNGPADAALMSMNMLVQTMGKNYTWGEFKEWLIDAGLSDFTTFHFLAPAANGALIARGG